MPYAAPILIAEPSLDGYDSIRKVDKIDAGHFTFSLSYWRQRATRDIVMHIETVGRNEKNVGEGDHIWLRAAWQPT